MRLFFWKWLFHEFVHPSTKQLTSWYVSLGILKPRVPQDLSHDSCTDMHILSKVTALPCSDWTSKACSAASTSFSLFPQELASASVMDVFEWWVPIWSHEHAPSVMHEQLCSAQDAPAMVPSSRTRVLWRDTPLKSHSFVSLHAKKNSHFRNLLKETLWQMKKRLFIIVILKGLHSFRLDRSLWVDF